jgi:pimeloyl-ACP methyl ester carboxylesterase
MAGNAGERARDKAPLVFIHGDFGDGADSWGVALAEIGARRRSVVFDRPGFGSDLHDERFTIDGDARYLLAAIADLGLDAYHLVGHSYGGLVALEMTLMHSAGVRSLHLIEPPWLDLLPGDSVVRELDERVRAIQERHRDGDEEGTAAAFFTAIGSERSVVRLAGTPDWRRISAYAARFAVSEAAGVYSRSRLNRLPADVPMALYSGGRSHPALRAIAVELAGRIAGARLTELPDAGHAVQMAGAAFVTPLLALVEEVDERGDPTEHQMGGGASGC